jgi:rhodanese-related sulfurtransferase
LPVERLAEWRRSGTPHVLLDVREDDEVAAAALAGALHIPMNEVPQRLAEIPQEQTLAVLCHHGERSFMVARFLAARGYDDVYNVEGGIDRYAATIDPSVPRYR